MWIHGVLMKYHRIRNTILLGGALILLAFVRYSPASGDTTPMARESDYNIYSRRMRVGELKTICEVLSCNEKRVMKFASSIKVNVNLLRYGEAHHETDATG